MGSTLHDLPLPTETFSSVLLPWREEELEEGDDPFPFCPEGRDEGE